MTSKLGKTYEQDGIFRVLTLDGGGAKGFYTLGAVSYTHLDVYKRQLIASPSPSYLQWLYLVFLPPPTALQTLLLGH